tara:strand:- start:615 stop:953 length:339 start_codon:yes stop_codon:yes gene_type:complete
MKLIESKLKERPKRLRFIPVDPEPTDEQIKLFYILNAIDLGLTVHGLKHPNIYEANPLLKEKPSNLELITHKSFFAPLVAHNMNQYQMSVINSFLVMAIINNAHQIDKVDAW